MSALEADVAFDFTFSSPSPSPSFDDPATPPMHGVSLEDAFDFNAFYVHDAQHLSSAKGSTLFSAPSVTLDAKDPMEACLRFDSPPAIAPTVRQHGPLLLPKIRPQDQEMDHFQDFSINPMDAGLLQHSTPPSGPRSYHHHAQHGRSYTNPEINSMAFAHMSPFPVPASSQQIQIQDETATFPSALLGSPATFAQSNSTMAPPRRASCSIDTAAVERGYSPCRQIILLPSTPTVAAAPSEYVFPSASLLPREASPASVAPPPAMTPEPTPSTTLMAYLTAPNPAASLVRTISFPHRDPSIKHFWWDVRNVRSWSSFNASAILALPGASDLLNTPVPLPMLPTPKISSRHPETEAGLYSIYASYFLPKLNSALAISSHRPLQLSTPAKTLSSSSSSSSSSSNDLLFVANAAGESSTAAAIFGGKPSARIVGLVRSFTRFNTGMRSEGNIKRVDYLRGLAALHHAMREHGCRYGFILTEIELVLVRAGTLATPYFGDVEITAVQLSAAASSSQEHQSQQQPDAVPMTACLALWGLCQLAGDATPVGHATWKAEIGAPAEGTRRKAKARDAWIPQPQLAEKREAKRARGWVWPEDPIGRKELGKRGVKYGGI